MSTELFIKTQEIAKNYQPKLEPIPIVQTVDLKDMRTKSQRLRKTYLAKNEGLQPSEESSATEETKKQIELILEQNEQEIKKTMVRLMVGFKASWAGHEEAQLGLDKATLDKFTIFIRSDGTMSVFDAGMHLHNNYTGTKISTLLRLMATLPEGATLAIQTDTYGKIKFNIITKKPKNQNEIWIALPTEYEELLHKINTLSIIINDKDPNLFLSKISLDLERLDLPFEPEFIREVEGLGQIENDPDSDKPRMIGFKRKLGPPSVEELKALINLVKSYEN